MRVCVCKGHRLVCVRPGPADSYVVSRRPTNDRQCRSARAQGSEGNLVLQTACKQASKQASKRGVARERRGRGPPPTPNARQASERERQATLVRRKKKKREREREREKPGDFLLLQLISTLNYGVIHRQSTYSMSSSACAMYVMFTGSFVSSESHVEEGTNSGVPRKNVKFELRREIVFVVVSSFQS